MPTREVRPYFSEVGKVKPRLKCDKEKSDAVFTDQPEQKTISSMKKGIHKRNRGACLAGLQVAPMVAHLRPANLRDILVRAKLPAVDRRRGASRGTLTGFKKCGKTRCLCCVYSKNTNTHTSTLTGQTWPIKHSITCEDSNVVYNVTCSHKAGQCLRRPAQYIGKVGSTRPCRIRCTEHRGAVTHHFDTGVGEHFNLPGHDLADFNFLPFEKIRSRDPFVVEARESYWIEKYGVLGEGGMNRRS